MLHAYSTCWCWRIRAKAAAREKEREKERQQKKRRKYIGFEKEPKSVTLCEKKRIKRVPEAKWKLVPDGGALACGFVSSLARS